MKARQKTFFDYLVQNNIISEIDLENAFAEADKWQCPVEELLMKQCRISREDFGRAMEDYCRCRYIHYNPKHPIPDDLFKNLKREYLLRELWVPFEKGDDGKIRVIVDDPNNLLKKDQIENLLRTRHVEYCVSLKDDIIKFINHFYQTQEGKKSFSELLGNEGQLVKDHDEYDKGRTPTMNTAKMMERLDKSTITSLIEELKQREKLHEITNRIHAAQNIKDILVEHKEGILALFNALLITIYVTDKPRNELYSLYLAGSQLKEIRLPITNRSIAGFVANTGRGVNIADAYDKEELIEIDKTLFFDVSWDKQTGYRTTQALAVPILHENTVMGVIQIVNRKGGGKFTDDEQSLLEYIAAILGIAFHNLKLDAASQEAHPDHQINDNITEDGGPELPRTKSHHFKEAIEELRSRLETTRDMRDIFVAHKDSIAALLNAELVTIYAVDKPRNEIYTRYIRGSQLSEDRLPINNRSIAGFVANAGRGVSIADAYDKEELKKIDKTLFHDEAWDTHWGYRAIQLLALPIMHANARMGVIQIVNRKGGGIFTDDEQALLEEIAEVLGIALYNHHRALSPRKTRFDYLVVKKHLTFSELDAAFVDSRRNNVPIEEVLMKQYGISRTDIGRALEEHYGCRYIPFSPMSSLPENFLKHIRSEYLCRELWAPIEKTANGITRVVMIDPSDTLKKDVIENLLSTKSIEYCVSLREDIMLFIDYAYTGGLSDFAYSMWEKNYPQERFAAACKATEMLTADTISSRLRELNSGPKPLLIKHIDAMCYDTAFPPDRLEYVCPACREKTLYARRETEEKSSIEVEDIMRSLQKQREQPYYCVEKIEDCRRTIKNIKGIHVELDESQFCRKCRPDVTHPVLLLKVHLGNGCKITPEIRHRDLVLLADFVEGIPQTSGGYEALADHLPRLEELLGVKMDG